MLVSRPSRIAKAIGTCQETPCIYRDAVSFSTPLLQPFCSWAPRPRANPPPLKKEETEEDVTRTEDLMRELGLLKRVLLVYDEVHRGSGQRGLRPETVAAGRESSGPSSGSTTRELEERHLFPRFRSHHTLVDLVDVLGEQHRAGRGVTERILVLATGGLKGADDKKELAAALASFVRMYAPHEAREDTVLFPALRGLVSANEYDALGETFEKEEHKKFGQDGFEKMVERVAGLEKTLGIYDLKQFTPR
jgi:hemerythrin superfamily protein